VRVGSDSNRNSISTDPENLTVVNTLAALGIVTEDDALVDAALSEIVSLPYEQRAASVTY
jgi:superkiller protein 3